jgi:hypothetical protein
VKPGDLAYVTTPELTRMPAWLCDDEVMFDPHTGKTLSLEPVARLPYGTPCLVISVGRVGALVLTHDSSQKRFGWVRLMYLTVVP